MAAALRQTAVIAAGNQPWNRHTVATSADGERFAYCSSVAMYVFRKDRFGRFALAHIGAGSRSTITGLAWCPDDANAVATTNAGRRVAVWDVSSASEAVATATGEEMPLCLDYAPASLAPSTLAYGTDNGSIVLWCAVEGGGGGGLRRLKEACHPGKSSVLVLRFNQRCPARLAAGFADGAVVVADIASEDFRATVRRFKPPSGLKRPETIDVAWDPLSTGYLLVAHRSGNVVLLDAESQTQLNSFDIPSGGLTALRWLPDNPGGFVTADVKTGVLRLWNVSQSTPTGAVRLNKTAFHTFAFVGGGNQQRVFCAFRDGGIGLYDLRKRLWEFRRKQGHTETIFDCKFRPVPQQLLAATGGSVAEVLATGSFDASVKLWDAFSLSPIGRLEGHEGVVYCVSWAPGGESRLLACTSKGIVYLWNTEALRLMARWRVHKDAVYRVTWCDHDPALFATCSRDGSCTVSNVADGKPVRQYNLGFPVYGCSWSPLQRGLLALGCHDGRALIFDVRRKEDTPIGVLQGHTSRVFNTAWSPLVPDVLATSSDDFSVRVWSASTGTCLAMLIGHTDKSRALAWSPEVPHLLLSGSWDGTIRLWDIRGKGRCLAIGQDHHADVYGLDFSRMRPFVFASSSRDTTARLWSLDKVADPLRLRALVGPPCWRDLSAAALPSSSKPLDPATPVALSGTLGATMDATFRAVQNDVERARLTHIFFYGSDGTKELLDLIAANQLGRPCPASNRIVGARELVARLESKAKALEAARSQHEGGAGTIGAVRRDESLAEAAETQLRLGHYREYCELCIDLNRWLEALAVAPAVGTQFWASLCSRYASYLSEHGSSSNGARPETFLLASGNVNKAIDFLCNAGRVDEAVVSAAVASLAAAQSLAVSEQQQQQQQQTRPPSGRKSASSARSKQQQQQQQVFVPLPALRQTCDLQAAHYFFDGQPVLAACCHLSIGDTTKALQKLLQGGEHELAYTLATLTGMRSNDAVYPVAAKRAESLGLWESALTILGNMRTSAPAVTLLCARFAACHTSEETKDFFLKAGLRPQETFAQSGAEAELRGAIDEAVRCYVAAGREYFGKALDLGCKLARKELAKPELDTTQVDSVLESLASIPLEHFGSKRSSEVRAIAAFVGAYHAAWRGYFSLMPFMIFTVKMLTKDADIELNTGPLEALHRMGLVYNVELPSRTLPHIPDGSKLDSAISKDLEAWTALIFEVPVPMLLLHRRESLCTHEVVVAGSTLPSRGRPETSALTGNPINGTPFEVDGHLISRAEALMWARVDPFPPFGNALFCPW